jgi:hypothetical protein
MDQATLTAAIIRLFDMLLPQKWTGNTAAIKKQLALILNWVKYEDKSDKYYLEEDADAAVEFNPRYPKTLILGMPKEDTPGAKRQLETETTESKRNKVTKETKDENMHTSDEDEGEDELRVPDILG